MDLDGLLRRTELGSDLLVQLPGRDQLEHLALARGEAREAAHEILALAMLRAPDRITQQRLAYGGYELGAPHRLGEQGDRAGFHRLHRRRNVALSGDEDDGPVNAALRQRALQLEATHVGHANVSDQTTGCFRIVCLEE